MQHLINAITQCETTEQITTLFDNILTHKEKEDLDKRILILHELIEAKQTQREIAKSLNVSIFNVSRGANMLKEKGSSLREIPPFKTK